MKTNNLILLLLAACLSLTITGCDPEPEPIPNPQPGDTTQYSATQPRYMAAADGNVYITCYSPHSVLRFDTATMRFTGLCPLGQYNPEGICATGGKLYVASSNISDERYNYSYDNKLYVIDIASFTIEDSITVNLNPSKVMVLDATHLVVSTLGDYPALGGSVYGKTQIVDLTDKSVSDLDVNLYNFDIYDGQIYGYTDLYSALAFYRVDGTTHQSTAILTDWDASLTPYGISVNACNGDLIVNTNGNYRYAGDCYVYHNDGTLRMNAVELGMLPSKAIGLDGDRLLVLDEGNWSANEAEISRVEVAAGTAQVNFFSAANGRGLGDVGQDMIRYGGKVYVTVTFSNSLEVVDPLTGRSTRIGTF